MKTKKRMPSKASILQMAGAFGITTKGRRLADIYADINSRLNQIFHACAAR